MLVFPIKKHVHTKVAREIPLKQLSSQQYHFGESIRNSLNELVKVSKNYKFKVHIRDDELIVRRIDKKEGWDFDMYLRVLNKPLHGDYEG